MISMAQLLFFFFFFLTKFTRVKLGELENPNYLYSTPWFEGLLLTNFMSPQACFAHQPKFFLPSGKDKSPWKKKTCKLFCQISCIQTNLWGLMCIYIWKRPKYTVFVAKIMPCNHETCSLKE